MKTASIRKQLGFWAFALLALTGTTSCGGDDHDDHDEGAATGAVCPTASTLTYANFGQPFMKMYCTRCHSSELTGDKRNGAPSGHDFDTLAGILKVADHIDEHAAAGPKAVNTEMPPSDPKPSEDDRRKLGEWLACETKEDDAGGGGDSGGSGDGGGTMDTGRSGDGGGTMDTGRADTATSDSRGG